MWRADTHSSVCPSRVATDTPTHYRSSRTNHVGPASCKGVWKMCAQEMWNEPGLSKHLSFISATKMGLLSVSFIIEDAAR